MLLYYITDRSKFPGTESLRRARLLEKIAEAARAGVDFIQLREKDLSALALADLAREAIEIIGENSAEVEGSLCTRLLINSRTDVAIAVGAAGVHLPANDLSAREARGIWEGCARGARGGVDAVISVSCHTIAEVAEASMEAADFAVLAPVFEKKDTAALGLDTLRTACGLGIDVIALGGVSAQNGGLCIDAGAAGVAGIRLFQENDVASAVSQLRGRAGG